MRKLKKVISLVVFTLLFTTLMNYSNIYGYHEIKIYVNQQPLSFDVGARNINNRVLVPFRGILEALDAKVEWDEKSKTVTAKKEDIEIKLTIGSTIAYRNNQSYQLDVPAQIINNRTFIPVRFVSEALGLDVHWDGIKQSVYITAPSIPFSYNGISLGSSLDSVAAKFGKPVRIDSSEYSFDWYIYHNNYKDYVQIGISNEKVVALYSNNPGWKNHYRIDIKDSNNYVRNFLKDPLEGIIKGNTNFMLPKFENGKEEYYVYQTNSGYLTIFFDLHNNNTVSAIQIIDTKIEEAYRASDYSTNTLRIAYEKQAFDLVNTTRVQKGLTPLQWSNEAATAAYKHSKDMGINKYFDHTNLKKESVANRLMAEGINYRRAGENIAAGHQNAIFAHENWMNSEGHRKMILGDFEKLGVGVWFGGPFKIYYTENFYTAK